MSADSRSEERIVRALAKFMAREELLLRRWRIAGRALVFVGSLLCSLGVLSYAQGAAPNWSYTVMAGLGGLGLGMGMWFSTFATQWPILRQFVDMERIHQRTKETV